MDDDAVLIRITGDGRRVDVRGGRVCLDGVPEADHLVPIEEHPNRAVIQRVLPEAKYVAGRLPLTLAEASVAQAALRRAQDRFDGSAAQVAERIRRVGWQRATAEGVE